MRYLGFDFSLTHSAIVEYIPCENRIEEILVYRRKDDLSILYKEHIPEIITNKLDKITSYINSYLQTDDYIIATDFSFMFNFNGRRQQIVATAFCVGYLSSILNLQLVTPREIRNFIGLKLNENKLVVQERYFSETALKQLHEMYNDYRIDKNSEDTLDAAILAYYISEITKESNTSLT